MNQRRRLVFGSHVFKQPHAAHLAALGIHHGQAALLQPLAVVQLQMLSAGIVALGGGRQQGGWHILRLAQGLPNARAHLLQRVRSLQRQGAASPDRGKRRVGVQHPPVVVHQQHTQLQCVQQGLQPGPLRRSQLQVARLLGLAVQQGIEAFVQRARHAVEGGRQLREFMRPSFRHPQAELPLRHRSAGCAELVQPPSQSQTTQDQCRRAQQGAQRGHPKAVFKQLLALVNERLQRHGITQLPQRLTCMCNVQQQVHTGIRPVPWDG